MDHYEQAAAATKKLRFLGRNREQLPFPMWDPDVCTDAAQLGPAETCKLVYLVTNSREQQHIVKFTQQYGVEVHRAWATAELAPKLLEQSQVAGTWQQVMMEYLPPELPDASGWLSMGHLLQPVRLQLETAPQELVLAPDTWPHLMQQAEKLLCKAHATPVCGLPAAHGDARPDNIMIHVRDGEILELKLIDMDWAGAAGRAVYPSLLNVKHLECIDGMEPGRVLDQAHDISLLHLKCTRAVHRLHTDCRWM